MMRSTATRCRVSLSPLPWNRSKTLPASVRHTQINGKIERFWLEYDRHRWRFDGILEFVSWYNNRIHGAPWIEMGENPRSLVTACVQHCVSPHESVQDCLPAESPRRVLFRALFLNFREEWKRRNERWVYLQRYCGESPSMVYRWLKVSEK